MKYGIIKSEDHPPEKLLSASWYDFLSFLENHRANRPLPLRFDRYIILDCDLEKIVQACELMEQTHDQQFRKDKSPYHNHIYRSVQILCENEWEKGLTLRRVICGLLHDSIEDSRRKNHTRNKIKKHFWDKVSCVCELLSKDKAVTPLMKVPRNQEYFPRFESLETLAKKIEELYPNKFTEGERQELAEDIAVIKIADRIDNLQTMQAMEADKIFEKIAETRQYLLPITQELWKKYPDLLQSLQNAILNATILAMRKKQTEALATT